MTNSNQNQDLNLNFEQSLNELEQLVHQLESGELSLADSLKKFERGIQLARVSQQQLTSAQQQVEILLSDQDNAELADFNAQDGVQERQANYSNQNQAPTRNIDDVPFDLDDTPF